MFSSLPPRVQMFLRPMLWASFGLFAAIGAVAVYRGDAELPNLWFAAAFTIGCAFSAVFRDVSSDDRHEQER